MKKRGGAMSSIERRQARPSPTEGAKSAVCRYNTRRQPSKRAHLEAIGVALQRSPAAYLVDTDEAAAVVELIASSQERCLNVLLFLDALTEQPAAVDPASEA